jgi:hypothetical protein
LQRDNQCETSATIKVRGTGDLMLVGGQRPTRGRGIGVGVVRRVALADNRGRLAVDRDVRIARSPSVPGRHQTDHRIRLFIQLP